MKWQKKIVTGFQFHNEAQTKIASMSNTWMCKFSYFLKM